MITLDFRDKHLIENEKAIRTLQEYGFSDDEIQILYDRQLVKDKEEENE